MNLTFLRPDLGYLAIEQMDLRASQWLRTQDIKKDLLQIQDPLLGPRITLTLYLVTRAMPKAPGLDGPGWPAEGYSNWQAALFWESGSGSSVDWSCTWCS